VLVQGTAEAGGGSRVRHLGAAIAGYGLAQGAVGLPEAPLPPSVWHPLLAFVQEQRVAGLIMHAVRDNAFPVTPAQRSEVAAAGRQDAAWMLLLERSLVSVSELFRRRGIDHRILKGPAVAHTVYPDPSLRSFADIDLLVRGEQFDDAIHTLTSEGGCRRNQEPRSGFVRRFGKSVAVAMPDQSTIDLHRTLAPGPYGFRIALDVLFRSGTPFTVAGRRLIGLGPEERFLHACYHAVLGDAPPRLVPLRDVVQSAAAPDFDIDRALRLASEWRALVIVAAAVSWAWNVFSMKETALSSWASQYVPAASERRILNLFRGKSEDHDEIRELAAIMTAIPGWRARTAYLRAQLLPSREYLGARGEGYVVHWLRGVSLVAVRSRDNTPTRLPNSVATTIPP
jgi:hypothetical protein